MASYHSVNLADEMSYHRRAVDLFRAVGNRQGAVSSLSLLAASSTSYDWPAPPTDAAELAAAIAAGEEAMAEAQEIGWRAGEAFACIALVMAHGATGDYKRARFLAGEGLRIAIEIEHDQWNAGMLRVLGELELDLLNPEAARAAFEEGLVLAKKTKSDFWTACLSAGLARALVALGEVQAASELIQPPSKDGPLVLTGWHYGCAEVEVALARSNYAAVIQRTADLGSRAWPDGRPSRLTLLRAEALLGSRRPIEASETIESDGYGR